MATETEYGTFSAAIDDVSKRSGRPDRRFDIMSWVRSSMREAQVLAWYEEDLVEEEITATADPHIWTPPDRYRIMRTVMYKGMIDPRGHPIFPDFVQPGKKMREHRYLYYQSGRDFVFQQHGYGDNLVYGEGITIALAYYVYLPVLAYYENIEDRPARYILETESWQYHPLYDVSDAKRQEARELVQHWMLGRWYDMCVEGGLAKVYKAYNDDRASLAFSLFERYKVDLTRGQGRAAVGGNI